MNIQLNVTDYFSGVIGEDCSKHGQIIGLLMPHVLSYYFPNLVLYSLDGVNGVLDVSTKRSYRVVSYYKQIDQRQSKCKGVGRDSIREDIEFTNKFDGLIKVRTLSFPILEVEIV